jgi:hypothetical protein
MIPIDHLLYRADDYGLLTVQSESRGVGYIIDRERKELCIVIGLQGCGRRIYRLTYAQAQALDDGEYTRELKEIMEVLA